MIFRINSDYFHKNYSIVSFCNKNEVGFLRIMEPRFKNCVQKNSGLASLNDFTLRGLARRFKIFPDSGIWLSDKQALETDLQFKIFPSWSACHR